jgi:hypothetical protein
MKHGEERFGWCCLFVVVWFLSMVTLGLILAGLLFWT